MNSLKASLFAGALALLAVTGAGAQENKPTPRTAEGTPDFNGTWDNGGGVAFVRPQKLPDGSICVAGCPAPARPAAAGATTATAAAARPAASPQETIFLQGTARPKYKDAFLAKVKDLDARQVLEDPVLKCRNPGLPRIGAPEKIVQTKNQMIFLYDDINGAFFRIIALNGKHRTDAEDSNFGDSVARWDGDTLVIESIKFNDETWITDDGAFHTPNMKVTERMRRVGDVIQYQAYVDDPEVLAERWVLQPRTMRLTDVEMLEPVNCVEQSIAAMVNPLGTEPDTHHDNPR